MLSSLLYLTKIVSKNKKNTLLPTAITTRSSTLFKFLVNQACSLADFSHYTEHSTHEETVIVDLKLWKHTFILIYIETCIYGELNLN